MLLKPIKCSKCGSPLKGKELDLMMQCPACGNILFFDKKLKETKEIDYKIISPTKEGKDTLVYIPFWVIHANLEVFCENIAGGGVRRAITSKHQMRGERNFYFCANNNLPEEITRIWNMDLTTEQPVFSEQSDFKSGKRMAMIVEEEVACSGAEFLFLRYETELPGTLEDLEYTFTVIDCSIIYLPAWKSGETISLAI